MIEQEPDAGDVRVLVAGSGDGSLQQLLLPLDVPVEAVADPATALARIRAHRPDLVLLDLDAEGLDAESLLRTLRRDRSIEDIPVILVGTDAAESKAVAALTAGADDYVRRPVFPDVLRERMRYALAVAELIRRITAARAELHAARELERVKRDFLGIAAYELRTQLAMAHDRVARLEDGATASSEVSDPVEVAEALPPLQRRLAIIARLVDAMAETAVLEERSPALDVTVVDLRDVVRAVVADIDPLPGDGEHVQVSSQERPLFVAVDEPRIRDVVASLVENALVGSGRAAVRVTLDVDAAEQCATVAITGTTRQARNGGGPRARSTFSKALSDDGMESAPGLGLLLGKAVARFHGGDLEVRRDTDAETTATLRLPLAGPRPRTTVLGGEVDLG